LLPTILPAVRARLDAKTKSKINRGQKSTVACRRGPGQFDKNGLAAGPRCSPSGIAQQKTAHSPYAQGHAPNAITAAITRPQSAAVIFLDVEHRISIRVPLKGRAMATA